MPLYTLLLARLLAACPRFAEGVREREVNKGRDGNLRLLAALFLSLPLGRESWLR